MEVKQCLNGVVTTTATRPRCHDQATCRASKETNGLRQCVCNEGLVGDGITECEGKCKLFDNYQNVEFYFAKSSIKSLSKVVYNCIFFRLFYIKNYIKLKDNPNLDIHLT